MFKIAKVKEKQQLSWFNNLFLPRRCHNSNHFICNFQSGIRKPLFTTSEKEVLQTVILKREQMAQDAAETQLAMNGSNGHLNTGTLL